MTRQLFCSLAAGAATISMQSAALAAKMATTHAEIAGLYASIPGIKAYQFSVGGSQPWTLSSNAQRALFMGSCFKTFVLATYLQEVEAGRLSLDELLTVSAANRSPSSPVLMQLSGKMAARNILEAMIAHSDNTATDIAMKRVGVDKVRAFIARAGLHQTRIPDSTRRFFSYVSGYPKGVDGGWPAMQALMMGKGKGRPRPAFNDVETMSAPPVEMVSYYQRVLRGEFFGKPETLEEFKRISWMADAIFLVIPSGTPAYMKGGSVDWDGFYAIAACGQMLVGAAAVTFASMANWHEKDGSEASVSSRWKATTLEATSRIKNALLQ